MTIIELRTKKESDIEYVLNWEPVKQMIIYKALYAMGQRMDGIEIRIDEALRQEIKAGG